MTIKQPRNTITNTYSMKWHTTFSMEHNKEFKKAQKFLDSEALKHSSKRVPLDSGTLQTSGILNTIVGSGIVKWSTPYARRLYYNPQYTFQGAPMRGGQWFARMKADIGKNLLKSAMKIATGGGK